MSTLVRRRLTELGIPYTLTELGHARIPHPRFPGWHVTLRSTQDVDDLERDLADTSIPIAAQELERKRDTKKRQRDRRRERQEAA